MRLQWRWLPPRSHVPKRTHLSGLHADQVLADAMDAERLGARFTVIIFGGALGAMCLGWAVTTVGYTREQYQGSCQGEYLFLSINKKKKVQFQINGIHVESQTSKLGLLAKVSEENHSVLFQEMDWVNVWSSQIQYEWGTPYYLSKMITVNSSGVMTSKSTFKGQTAINLEFVQDGQGRD